MSKKLDKETREIIKQSKRNRRQARRSVNQTRKAIISLDIAIETAKDFIVSIREEDAASKIHPDRRA